jgi:long-chain fatty acid transport protein
MKKMLTFLILSGIILLSTSSVLAGGIINKQNFSAEYLRSFSRNAATDAADVVVYNPAGVMKMEDGAYVNFGIFHAFKTYTNTIGGQEYESDAPSTIPGLFAVYKQAKWAGFAAFTIPAGGGTVEYEDGNATSFAIGQGYIAGANAQLAAMGVPSAFWYNSITDQSVKADSFTYGYTFGGAYEVNDSVSISLGLRYLDAQKEAKGSATISAPDNPLGITDRTAEIDYEETADGWGGFVGINIVPAEKWNIGIRYETKTKLDFETKVNKDTLGILTDGAKEREDLPGLLGLGASYIVNPKVKLDASLTYYLEEDASWEDERLKDAGNSYDLALALTYTFNPKLKGSLGYMYTDTDIDPDDMLPEAPELDAQTVCAGAMYEAIPRLNLNFALMHTFYKEETTSTGVELDKSITGIGFGIQYKFK